MQRIKLSCLAMLLLLTSCANGQETDLFCIENSPIYVSRVDHISGSTARQIDVYNDFGEAKCGWQHSQ